MIALSCDCATSHVDRMLEEAAAKVQATQARRGNVSLRCFPSDAEVWLGGVPWGTCSIFSGREQGLWAGKAPLHIVVRKEGFEPWETVIVPDGTRAAFDVTLVPSTAAKTDAPH